MRPYYNDNLNNLCVRKTPPEFGPNRSFSVLSKHNTLQINAFIFSKNLHNPEVPGLPAAGRFKSRSRYSDILQNNNIPKNIISIQKVSFKG